MKVAFERNEDIGIEREIGRGLGERGVEREAGLEGFADVVN